MPLFDFFRNIFGKLAQEPPQYRFDDDERYKDGFRNPIWQNDEDEDEVSDFSRQPRNRYQFKIFSDPFEMTRFFETQMDDMMKNFFGFDGFGNFFGNNFSDWKNDEGNDFFNALPIPDEKLNDKGPRDEVIKPSCDTPGSTFTFGNFANILPRIKSNEKGPLDEVLKPSYEMPNPKNPKLDSDLDGKIKSDELAKIWKAPSTSETVESFSPFSFRSFGTSVSTQIVKRPDGSIEERRTVRDSDGNEEIKITRQIGDKIHTVITKKAKDGSEVKTEDIVNMDENELKGFDDKWTKTRIIPKDNADDFPWHKFFGPKL